MKIKVMKGGTPTVILLILLPKIMMEKIILIKFRMISIFLKSIVNYVLNISNNHSSKSLKVGGLFI